MSELRPSHIHRINNLHLSPNQKKPAQLMLVNGLIWIAIVTFFGLSLMLYILEPKEALWATVQTKAAKPSLEIVP